jgi:peptide/nickel transport system substrate-binding protein
MKGRPTWLVASGSALTLVLAACGGSTSPPSTSTSTQQSSANQTFTYDTYTGVMIDGWDPATEYSNGIIAMSEMYQTLTHL